MGQGKNFLLYSPYHLNGATPPPVSQTRTVSYLEYLDGHVLWQFTQLNLALQAMFFFANFELYQETGKTLTITSLWRPNSTHKYWRGLDFDVDENESLGGVTPAEAEWLAQKIDTRWNYDPSRPQFFCCLYGWRDPSRRHDNHGHMQCCWGGRTIYLADPREARRAARKRAKNGSRIRPGRSSSTTATVSAISRGTW